LVSLVLAKEEEKKKQELEFIDDDDDDEKTQLMRLSQHPPFVYLKMALIYSAYSTFSFL
jgi:hypothetical protein